MNRSFNKIWKETLIIAFGFSLLGCFMFTQPEKTLAFFSYIIGALILVLAILAFYRHYRLQRSITFELLYGVICTVGALLIFLNQSIIETLIPIVLGAVMVANSLFKIQYIFDLKKDRIEKWFISLILTLCKIALGIIMIVNPLDSLVKLTQFIGMLVFVYACLDVVDLCFIKSHLKNQLSQEKINKNDQFIEDVKYREIDE